MRTKSSGTADYCSSAIRRFFPCRSGDGTTLQTLREIQDISANNLSDASTLKFVGEDNYAWSHSCESRTVGYSFTKSNPRSFVLHTLHHGTIRIAVRDIICDVCRCLLPFEGAIISLFGLNKKHSFARELLDSWFWDICGTGGTFRDAFYSWHSRRSAKARKFIYWVNRHP